MPETTEKRDRFERVIIPRVRRAADAIDLIATGAGRNYETTPQEIADLLVVVREALEAVEARYAKHLGSATTPTITPPSVEADAPVVKRPTTLRETPHIQQIAEFVASLPSEHLPSYITHLVNRLCEQAEQTKSAA